MEYTKFTYEEAIKKIDKFHGKPIAVEAQWDGDTNGWFLMMFVIMNTGFWFFSKYETKHIGNLALGNDFRLFNGTVPPYPEAKLAIEIGEKLKSKYDIEFFFPSPINPDNDCPSWIEKDKAIECADCNKLIIPTDSKYLPKEICYNCHLIRESNERIINNEDYSDGVNMYIFSNEKFKNIGYCTYFESFTIAPFIQKIVDNKKTKKGIDIIILKNAEIIELKEQLIKALDKELSVYKKPELEEREKRFIGINIVEYDNIKIELQDRRNENHSSIANLIESIRTAKKTLYENGEYRIYFKNDFTYRDDAILRFVNYVQKGNTNFNEIYKKYENILSKNELNDTIEKLIKIDCLNMENNQISITQTGKNIL